MASGSIISRQARKKFNCKDTNTASKGETLKPGNFICSKDEEIKFGITTDGSLSLFQNETKIWSASYFKNRPPCNIQNGCVTSDFPFLKVQGDGNVVLYNSNSKGLWSSKTSGNNNIRVIVNNDGSVIMVNNSKVVWTLNMSIPTTVPTASPTFRPSISNTHIPTENISETPTISLSMHPLMVRTSKPSLRPSIMPTAAKTQEPSRFLSVSPNIVNTDSSIKIIASRRPSSTPTLSLGTSNPSSESSVFSTPAPTNQELSTTIPSQVPISNNITCEITESNLYGQTGSTTTVLSFQYELRFVDSDSNDFSTSTDRIESVELPYLREVFARSLFHHQPLGNDDCLIQRTSSRLQNFLIPSNPRSGRHSNLYLTMASRTRSYSKQQTGIAVKVSQDDKAHVGTEALSMASTVITSNRDDKTEPFTSEIVSGLMGVDLGPEYDKIKFDRPCEKDNSVTDDSKAVKYTCVVVSGFLTLHHESTQASNERTLIIGVVTRIKNSMSAGMYTNTYTPLDMKLGWKEMEVSIIVPPTVSPVAALRASQQPTITPVAFSHEPSIFVPFANPSFLPSILPSRTHEEAYAVKVVENNNHGHDHSATIGSQQRNASSLLGVVIVLILSLLIVAAAVFLHKKPKKSSFSDGNCKESIDGTKASDDGGDVSNGCKLWLVVL